MFPRFSAGAGTETACMNRGPCESPQLKFNLRHLSAPRRPVHQIRDEDMNGPCSRFLFTHRLILFIGRERNPRKKPLIPWSRSIKPSGRRRRRLRRRPVSAPASAPAAAVAPKKQTTAGRAKNHFVSKYLRDE